MKLVKKALTALGAISLLGVQAFARTVNPVTAQSDMIMDGEDKFLTIVNMMAIWMQYVGLAVAFFGAVQLGFGFRSDDAEAKSKGMRSMIAGFIVFAIALAVGFFFNVT